MDQGNEQTFKSIVRQERERRGWSQSNLAEKVGVTPMTVNRWENGKNLPQSFPRQKLCEIFEKTPEELGLFNGTKEIPGDEIRHDTGQQSNLTPSDTSTDFQEDTGNAIVIPTSLPSSSDINQLPDSHSASTPMIIKGPLLSRRSFIAGAGAAALVLVAAGGGFTWYKL